MTDAEHQALIDKHADLIEDLVAEIAAENLGLAKKLLKASGLKGEAAEVVWQEALDNHEADKFLARNKDYTKSDEDYARICAFLEEHSLAWKADNLERAWVSMRLTDKKRAAAGQAPNYESMSNEEL